VLSSVAFYGALADRYDALFLAPHRRAYDQLAWEVASSLLPDDSGTIVDLGCGTGRWSQQLVELGHHVVGVEPTPAMAAIARSQVPSQDFELIEATAEAAEIADGCADMVLAMGSLQYVDEPRRVVGRAARWLRPGGWLVVLVDSLVALVAELLAAGKPDEAFERLGSRTGRWSLDGREVTHHLADRAEMEQSMRAAGLVEISVRGLLVGATIFGRQGLATRLEKDWAGQIDVERRLSYEEQLADLGKQLLAIARRPLPSQPAALG
jgi:SAM-dependent methyltransferase